LKSDTITRRWITGYIGYRESDYFICITITRRWRRRRRRRRWWWKEEG